MPSNLIFTNDNSSLHGRSLIMSDVNNYEAGVDFTGSCSIRGPRVVKTL
jgi:hypothetical protein